MRDLLSHSAIVFRLHLLLLGVNPLTENPENKPKDVADPKLDSQPSQPTGPQTPGPQTAPPQTAPPQTAPPQTAPPQTATLKPSEEPKKNLTPIFSLKLKAKILEAILTAIAVIIDEATFTISAASVNLRAMDPSRVVMIVFGYPKEAFDEFAVDREGKITFNIAEALKIVKRASKDETVEFVMSNEATLGRLLLTIKVHGKYERVFTLPILESSEEELPEPKINFDTTVKMTADALNNAVQDTALVSDHVKVIASSEVLEFAAAGDTNEAQVKFVKGLSEGLLEISKQDMNNATKAVFSLSYLTEMAKKLVDVADTVTLEYATDMPMKIQAQNVKGSMVFYQAPRIEVE